MSRLQSEPPTVRMRIGAGLGLAARTLRAMLGEPDYEAYLAHRRQQHPHAPEMSRAEFFNSRQAARYRRGSSRCC